MQLPHDIGLVPRKGPEAPHQGVVGIVCRASSVEHPVLEFVQGNFSLARTGATHSLVVETVPLLQQPSHRGLQSSVEHIV
eukprot:4149866-Heterocapsa_arctica.AAC.1